MKTSGSKGGVKNSKRASPFAKFFIEVLAKLTLANHTAIQELQAAAARAYLISANLAGIKESKEAFEAYVATTKKEGPDRKRGPIRTHAALALIQTLVQNVTDEGDSKILKD